MKPYPQEVLSANTASWKHGLYCTGDSIYSTWLTSCYIKHSNLSPQCNISRGALSMGHWYWIDIWPPVLQHRMSLHRVD